MYNVLRAFSCLAVTLIMLGGAMIPTRFGKVEVASIDPFGVFFLIFLGIAARWLKKDHERFLAWVTAKTDFLFNFKAPLKILGWLIFLIYFSLFIAHQFSYWSFHTHFFDMGFLHQALFYPFSDGKLLQADLSPHRSFLVDHFALTLLLITPITALFKSNTLVFVIQAGLVGLGVFWMVSQGPLRKHRAYLLFAAMILLSHRSLRNVVVWDFREDIFGFIFLCGALIHLLRGNRIYYFLFLIGTCLSKEHLGILGFGLLLPIFFDQGLPYSKKERTALAVQTALLLMGWNLLLFGWIVPTLHQRAQDMSNIASRYPQYGTGTGEILIRIFTTPWIWWDLLSTKVLVWSSIRYLILLLVPYIYFGWRAWPWLLAPVVGVIANMTSANILQKSLSFHYEIGWIPFFIFATLLGIKKVIDSGKTPALIRRSLIFGLFLAISFSGRWPLYSVFELIPTLEQIQDSSFISSAECQGVIGANHSTLTKLIHCQEVRQIVLAEGCSGDPIRSLLLQNSSDTSRVPGQSIAQASEMILDQRSACEKTILMALLDRGARSLRISKSGNFVHIEVPARVIFLNPS